MSVRTQRGTPQGDRECPTIEPGQRHPTAGEEEFHRHIVEGMTCGVLTIDRSGQVTTINGHARAMLDLPPGPVLGEPCHEILAHCPRLADVLMDSFSMSTPPSRAEMEIRTRDDLGRTIGFSISMIGGGGDAPPDGAALFFKDLTKVEEQAERERLRDRLVVLGEMAAQMAHEIRNPLASIHVSATLQRRKLSAAALPTDLVERIESDVHRIETTIADCLTYAKPVTPGLRDTDPVRLLKDAIALAGRRVAPGGAVVMREFGPGLRRFLCDSAQLGEAIVNILVNAHEALEGKGRITVSAEVQSSRAAGQGGGEEPGDFLFIRIEDTGPGIPAEIRNRIFHPFFTTKTRGSGIGLAMARKVVEAHGGWIDVESEPGKGARFSMKIPMPPAAGGTDTGGGR